MFGKDMLRFIKMAVPHCCSVCHFCKFYTGKNNLLLGFKNVSPSSMTSMLFSSTNFCSSSYLLSIS